MADAFDLSGILQMDAGGFVDPASEAAGASDEVSTATSEMSDSLFDVEPAGIAAGGALAGVGTAAQGILDETQSMNESLGRTATTMDMTTDETRDLATSMSDATFPLDDVTGTMDALAQQGIESEEAMREVATSADLVADATGTTAESVATNAGPALAAMGEDVEDLNQHMDTFTFVARETTMDVEDFSSTVRRVGPEIDEMGLSVDETAAIMAALEDQGLDSRTAMREFRQAANNADGDQEKLMESLDLTNDELSEQEEALADAEGMTQAHADAANESLSTMDRLRARMDDAKLAASEYLGPLSALAPAAQAAGVAMIGLSTINTAAVAPSFAAVSAAALPIAGIVLGLAAAATAAAVVWERDIGGIQAKTETAMAVVSSAFGTLVDVVSDAIATASYILFEWDPQQAIDDAVSAMQSRIAAFDPASMMREKTSQLMDAIPTASEVASRMGDIHEEVGATTAGFLSDSWNAIIPAKVGVDPVTLPTTEVDAGPLGSTTVGGQTVFEGVTFDIPQLATGGRITGDGIFRGGEEGDELVLNADQTADVDKGEVDLGGGMDDRALALLEQILAELRTGFAISGMSGSLSLDGDVATLDDIRGELRRVKRQSDNRGIR